MALAAPAHTRVTPSPSYRRMQQTEPARYVTRLVQTVLSMRASSKPTNARAATKTWGACRTNLLSKSACSPVDRRTRGHAQGAPRGTQSSTRKSRQTGLEGHPELGALTATHRGLSTQHAHPTRPPSSPATFVHDTLPPFAGTCARQRSASTRGARRGPHRAPRAPQAMRRQLTRARQALAV